MAVLVAEGCEGAAGSGGEDVGLDAGIALLRGPQRKRHGCDVVDDRNGVAVFGEVDGAEEVLAGVAGIHADVRKLFGDVDGQLCFARFAATGAEDAAKFPLVRAERALQIAFCSVAFRAHDAQKRKGIAARAAGTEHGR